MFLLSKQFDINLKEQKNIWKEDTWNMKTMEFQY
jgi:hypothetical protein